MSLCVMQNTADTCHQCIDKTTFVQSRVNKKALQISNLKKKKVSLHRVNNISSKHTLSYIFFCRRKYDALQLY